MQQSQNENFGKISNICQPEKRVKHCNVAIFPSSLPYGPVKQERKYGSYFKFPDASMKDLE